MFPLFACTDCSHAHSSRCPTLLENFVPGPLRCLRAAPERLAVSTKDSARHGLEPQHVPSAGLSSSPGLSVCILTTPYEVVASIIPIGLLQKLRYREGR